MKTSQILLLCTLFWFLAWGIAWFLVLNLEDVPENTLYTWTPEHENNFQNIQDFENTITQLASEVTPSVVNIIIKKDLPLFRENPFWFFRQNVGSIETEVGWWTWFFIDRDGTIITNKHVVKDQNAHYSVVLNDGSIFDAQILWLDPVNDLALIKIDYESVPMRLATKNDTLKIGQFVIAVWNALSEFQNSVSFWVVSGKDRIIKAQWENLSSLIQTDTAINPGNSGWPLIDITWKVIGINTAIANGQWIGFSIALSSEKIASMLSSIEKYWEIKKPFIGIYYVPVTDEIVQATDSNYAYWIYIPNTADAVITWSAADNAGLKSWDTILSINQQSITQENTLDIILQNSFPWEILEFEVLRDWELKFFDLELGEV